MMTTGRATLIGTMAIGLLVLSASPAQAAPELWYAGYQVFEDLIYVELTDDGTSGTFISSVLDPVPPPGYGALTQLGDGSLLGSTRTFGVHAETNARF